MNEKGWLDKCFCTFCTDLKFILGGKHGLDKCISSFAPQLHIERKKFWNIKNLEKSRKSRKSRKYKIYEKLLKVKIKKTFKSKNQKN